MEKAMELNEKNPISSLLEDYEEGSFSVPVKRKWWQFWLPKSVDAGIYIKIGGQWKLSAFQRVWFSLDEHNL